MRRTSITAPMRRHPEKVVSIVSVHETTHVPVADQLNQFRKAYAGYFPLSDFHCLLKLIEQGNVEVTRELGKPHLALIAREPRVEPFLESVFRAAADE